MTQNERKLIARLVQTGIQLERTPIFLDSSVVRKLVRRSPKQTSAREVGFGQISIQVQRLFDGDKCLFVQVFLIRSEQKQLPNISLGQLSPTTCEIRITFNGTFESLNRG